VTLNSSKQKGGPPELQIKVSRNRVCKRTSGPDFRARRSQDLPTPLAALGTSLSGLGAKRRRTSVLAAVTAATSCAAEALYKTLVGADCEAPFQFGEIPKRQRLDAVRFEHPVPDHARARAVRSVCVWHQSSTRAHEQRSPVAARSRASVLLIADALRPKRRAAPTTHPRQAEHPTRSTGSGQYQPCVESSVPDHGVRARIKCADASSAIIHGAILG